MYMYKSSRTLVALSGLFVLVAQLSAQQPHEELPAFRDPLKWPFSANSIWNTPIGLDAAYVHAGIEKALLRGLTVDEDVIVMRPEAQMMGIYWNSAAWDRSKSRCPVEGALLFSAPIPHDYIVGPGTWDGLTPNSGLAVLMPDRYTIRQTQPFAHCYAGDSGTSKYAGFPDQDIYGPGYYGAHGGSRLSAIGGALRVGELTPDSGPIRHALKVNLFAQKNLYYDEETAGFRWPATTADGSASSVYGTLRTTPVVRECRMGALLALPPWINLDSLEFETEPGRILAEAFRDYGAYVVDNTAWDVYGIITEWSPEGRFKDEFHSNWGFPFRESSKNSPWGRDIDRIFLNLHVVDNNGPNSIGGGGEPRVPPAPDFYPTTELTVETDSTTGGIAAPAGTFMASRGIETRIAAYTDPRACTFTHWTVEEGEVTLYDSASSSTIVILDTSAVRIRARFSPNYYSLATTASGEGSVIQDTVGETFIFGTEITLTASAQPGYEFTGWSGDYSGSENPLTISLTSDMIVTANFARIYHDLIAGASPGGSVARYPEEERYPGGTEVTLTAIPEPGWAFRNWTGDLTSELNPLLLTMDRDWILYASFDSTTTSVRPDRPDGYENKGRVTMQHDPSAQLLHFSIPHTIIGGRIEIFDMNGRIVKTVPIDNRRFLEVSAGEFGPGIFGARVVPDRGAPESFIWVNLLQ